MVILGIDPGAKESGYVVWDTETQRAIAGQAINSLMATIVKKRREMGDCIAIEVIRGYGIVAGDDTFDTCIWIGRFDPDCKALLIPRKAIKQNLCGNTTTNDKYVRQALIDRFGEVGTKKNPGPLFGISGHCWAALAVSVTAWDRYLK